MRLYVASTTEYAGKTLLALALGKIWSARGVSVGYVKPLGKIPRVEGGVVVDEDAAFLAGELSLSAGPSTVCPVVVTQDLLMSAYRGKPPRRKGRIVRSVREVSRGCDVLLLGGAANLRDGIFLGLDPRDLVKELDCRVLLVDRFGGERSMDQILWAAETLGTRLLGVVFNRVERGQEEFVGRTVRPCLEGRGIRVFGSIPHDPVLDSVSGRALAGSLGATVDSGEEFLDGLVERFCVGAMDVGDALRVFRGIPRKAVVTGGHRADIQLAALETDTRCLVLTGGVSPNDRVRARAQERGVPVLVVREDTMTAVERVERILGRIRIREHAKTARGVELVERNADPMGILGALKKGRRSRAR